MGKLLSEGFRRVFIGKRFYVCLIILICLAFLDVVIYRVANKFVDYELLHADTLIFSGLGLDVLFTAITGGMLISKDYSNNTIRNKIIIGHSRTNIYLCNWIVTAAIALVYHVAYLFVICALGIPVLGGGEFPSGEMMVNLLITVPLLLAFSSLIEFVCMSIKNVGGAIIAIAMHYVVSFMSLPMLLIQRKNEKLYEFLQEFVPSMQMEVIQQSYNEIPEHAALMVIYSIIIIVAATVGGILIFNRTDLK